MLEILGKTDIDFMGKRRWAFLFSGIMVVLGIVAVIQIARGSANLGIDFAGGTAVQLKFDQAIRVDEARKALEANGLADAELQEFGQENKLLIRLRPRRPSRRRLLNGSWRSLRRNFHRTISWSIPARKSDRPSGRSFSRMPS